MTRRAPLGWLCLLLAAGVLCGCVDVEERWTLEATGRGEYGLSLRYDADLLRRITGVVGESAVRRLEGRAFPIRPQDLGETLACLPGLEVLELREDMEPGGWRRITLRVGFERLEQLLAWEVLAGRAIEAGRTTTPSDAATPAARARLSMRPIDDVPLLDPLIDLMDEVERPPAQDSGGAPTEPGTLEQLGVAPAAAGLVADLLKVALAQTRVAVVVRVPGPVLAVGGIGRRADDDAVHFEWDLAALRSGTTSRGVELDWRLRELDEVITAAQAGDEPRPGRGPARER